MIVLFCTLKIKIKYKEKMITGNFNIFDEISFLISILFSIIWIDLMKLFLFHILVYSAILKLFGICKKKNYYVERK